MSERTAYLQLDYARELLTVFVKKAFKLYGDIFVVYNVHHLLHLGDVVERHGCLENSSAFRFENYLGQLKKKVKPGHKPLVQLAKRLRESPIKTSIWAQENLRMTPPKQCVSDFYR